MLIIHHLWIWHLVNNILCIWLSVRPQPPGTSAKCTRLSQYLQVGEGGRESLIRVTASPFWLPESPPHAPSCLMSMHKPTVLGSRDLASRQAPLNVMPIRLWHMDHDLLLCLLLTLWGFLDPFAGTGHWLCAIWSTCISCQHYRNHFQIPFGIYWQRNA